MPDDETITNAYVYLLARLLVIRQERVDREGEGFEYNKITYNPLGTADFANPNFDVAYLEAWFAVDERTPVILDVPEITGRYYTAQILDEWAEVIANINERKFPSKPFGKFALVAPGFQGSLPADATRIELHSRKAKLLGRVELKGDPDGAVTLQKSFKATPLGNPVILPPPFVKPFGNADLPGADIFQDIDARFSSAQDVAPNAAEMQQQVRAVTAYVASSQEAFDRVDKLIRKKAIPEFLEYTFTKASPYRNHWLVANAGGNFGVNFWGRAAANYAGIWTNQLSEVVYIVATQDAEGVTLDGSNDYVIHFPQDDLPSAVVNAYWSVILVGVPDYRVVPNDLKRYNFNSYSPLQAEPDGALKIAMGPKPVVGIAESNWLPTPDGKPFSLTFRAYVPKDIVKKGEWAPPPVTRLE
ncbi:DUF1214 domain-containing protein [Sphingomonas cavernae]|uniref:DUF1254 domain-containing protein n=1 Tax=Sphingomonas cavernae TaxID=2320861 RepID=A0A418W6R0_9SPHN|nr:DUF1214 domain-containing protein [Sphingomonas cavernae]RJF85735.1 DUF1254 domain-containing protein [Sphingomonas cavernae]